MSHPLKAGGNLRHDESHDTYIAYRTSGNSGVMEQGDKTAALNCATDPCQQIVHTLRAEGFDASEDGTGRGTPLVVGTLNSHSKEHGHCMASQQAAECGQLIPIDMRQAIRGATMTNNRTDGGAPGTGIGEDGDPSHTICDSHVPAVAFAQNQRDELREMQVAGAIAAEPGMKQQTYARTSMGVRRLMPIECERLQGFPDNWTAGHSDSARYRMLGNAVCVSVAEWIAKRFMEASP